MIHENCALCGIELPVGMKVGDKWVSLRLRRCCLTCVPYKSKKRWYRTREKWESYCNCKRCGKEKKYKGSYCNTCVAITRRVRHKLRAIELLGGKCSRCGWNKHPAGFEFHHRTDDKKFTVGNFWHMKWESLLVEIVKCELLCSCCHRIEHSRNFAPSSLTTDVNVAR